MSNVTLNVGKGPNNAVLRVDSLQFVGDEIDEVEIRYTKDKPLSVKASANGKVVVNENVQTVRASKTEAKKISDAQ